MKNRQKSKISCLATNFRLLYAFLKLSAFDSETEERFRRTGDVGSSLVICNSSFDLAAGLGWFSLDFLVVFGSTVAVGEEDISLRNVGLPGCHHTSHFALLKQGCYMP